MNQEFLVVKLMSTLQKFDGYHHDMVSHHKWYVPFVVVTISTFFLTYFYIFINSNMTGATSGPGTAYPNGHLSSSPVFSGDCVAQSLVFCIVFCRSLFFCLSFHHKFTAVKSIMWEKSFLEKFEDTKEVNRSNKSNDRQYNGQKIPME